ncbi:MAG: dihydroxyacetone kinase subunit DhaK [Actinobacteria bacterium]|nr:dihydroxyacetone kinase subunit DhaK [Actinomycetota bacterium]NBO47649.1 dihydroxyacetone kinase subunit DhaK [Actinomycetota bacterium]NBP43299.1 dihydroxyacetone kinase subunit DhaK [Actinomycetota bacterium]NBQ66717.1 dihydroxyacetone kinase subunit DhaK [Actinomycetota bacterium]NCU82893.1 dihydroxyacetone kinase subunit DhaK [Actinomycetota bacterium]
MKKLINDPFEVVDEMFEGFVKANDQIVRAVGKRSIARVESPIPGKVGIVVGGGSGHLPAFAGYVGKGMADGAAFGNIFASPPAKPIVEATVAVNSGAGVMYTYGNYQGDCINFDSAQEQCREMGIKVDSVVLNDDVLSSPKSEAEKRRGIGGLFLVWHVAGAKAEQLASLEDVVAVTRKANNNTRTVGVGLTSCTVPANGQPTFTLPDDEMEIGLGIHGEPGIKRVKLRPIDSVVDEMMESILADLDYVGQDVALLVNGLGGSPAEELYVVYRRVAQICEANKINIRFKHVGEQVTALEMAGTSISLMRLDTEMHDLIKNSVVQTCMYTKR